MQFKHFPQRLPAPVSRLTPNISSALMRIKPDACRSTVDHFRTRGIEQSIPDAAAIIKRTVALDRARNPICPTPFQRRQNVASAREVRAAERVQLPEINLEKINKLATVYEKQGWTLSFSQGLGALICFGAACSVNSVLATSMLPAALSSIFATLGGMHIGNWIHFQIKTHKIKRHAPEELRNIVTPDVIENSELRRPATMNGIPFKDRISLELVIAISYLESGRPAVAYERFFDVFFALDAEKRIVEDYQVNHIERYGRGPEFLNFVENKIYEVKKLLAVSALRSTNVSAWKRAIENLSSHLPISWLPNGYDTSNENVNHVPKCVVIVPDSIDRDIQRAEFNFEIPLRGGNNHNAEVAKEFAESLMAHANHYKEKRDIQGVFAAAFQAAQWYALIDRSGPISTQAQAARKLAQESFYRIRDIRDLSGALSMIEDHQIGAIAVEKK